MPIILARIDDRLIHGQVTEGWGKAQQPELILVVSDSIAMTDWECDLCLAALPSCIMGRVVKVDDAPQVINELLNDVHTSYVLFESPEDAYRVVENGALIKNLNVGGMHSTKGKREVLDYIYVDDRDSHYLKALRDMGVELDFRALPENENVDVLAIL